MAGPRPGSDVGLIDVFRAQAHRLRRDDEPVVASILRRLANYVEAGHADPAVTAALAHHVFGGIELGGQQTQAAIARLGSPLIHKSGWEARVLEELLASCLADAYTLALVSEGADWTGTLLEFETDAAKDAVSIPHRYWRQRAAGRTTRAALAAAIRSLRIEND